MWIPDEQSGEQESHVGCDRDIPDVGPTQEGDLHPPRFLSCLFLLQSVQASAPSSFAVHGWLLIPDIVVQDDPGLGGRRVVNTDQQPWRIGVSCIRSGHM